MSKLFTAVDRHHQYEVLLGKMINEVRNNNSLEELRNFDLIFSHLSRGIPQTPYLLDCEPEYVEQPKEIKPGYIEHKISLRFNGSKNLFQWIPSTCSLDTSGIYYAISELTDDAIILRYELEIRQENHGEIISKKISELKNLIQENLLNLKNDLDSFGDSLRNMVQQQVALRLRELENKEKILVNLPFKLQRNLNEAIKIERNIVERKIDPSGTTSKISKKTSWSHMGEKDFKDVLTLISNINAAFERLPKTFSLLDEPTIRDFLLIILQSVYSVVVGEAFNGIGKTDILIKHDSQNVFIAECKKWKGEASLVEAFEQLFGYIDTRLSKAAIIIFDENRNHQNTKQIISKKIPEIRGFQEQIEKFSEYGNIYKFLHPVDSGKEIHVAVLSFHKPIIQ